MRARRRGRPPCMKICRHGQGGDAKGAKDAGSAIFGQLQDEDKTMLTPEEYEAYLKHCKEIEAEEQRKQDEAKRKREEAEAERLRQEEEYEARLKKENPWRWELRKRAKEEEERKRAEMAEARKRDAEERLRKQERANAWAKNFETETLEDIADEILKVDADPSYILKFMEAPCDLNRLWIKRIMAARLRQKGGRK